MPALSGSEGEAGRRPLEIAFLGRIGYEEAVAVQEKRREGVIAGSEPEALYLLEHDPVFTIGRNADRADVVASQEWLEERGVAVADSSRGGKVTYHGPGQLVGYPILDLDPDRRDVRRYVQDLQEVLVRTLADYGVDAHPRAQPEIGVWVGPAKIASFGIHIRRWVTMHGFALNVATDLDHFGGIVACGLDDVQMTSIEELSGDRPSVAAVGAKLAGHFAAVFEREPLEPGR